MAHKNVFISLAAVALTALPLISSADAKLAKDPPAGLSAPMQAGFKAVKSFSAISGITGWVMQSPDGQYNIFYTTADGKYMLAGSLVSASGENLTQTFTEQHVPKPDLTKLWVAAEKSAYVAEGTGKSGKGVVYAFIDPNCVYCHYLWLALRPYVEAGAQVRWIPVGFLREDSAGKAADLLVNGVKALTKQQLAYGADNAPAGINVTPALKTKLDANHAIMRDGQINGTPGMLYKDASGTVVKRDGMPGLKDIAQILGMPERPQSDSRLDRFK